MRDGFQSHLNQARYLSLGLFCTAKFPNEVSEMPLFRPNFPESLGLDGRGIGDAKVTLTDPDKTHGVAVMAARGDVAVRGTDIFTERDCGH